MNLLDATSLPFDLCMRPTITYHGANDVTFEAYDRSVREMQLQIGDQELDETWAQVISDFRRYWYNASRVPLPFNHPFHTSKIDLPILQRNVDLGEYTRPTLARMANKPLLLLRELVGMDSNPLQEAMSKIIAERAPDQATVVLLAHSRYVPVVRSYYAQVGLEKIEVIDQNVLRRTTCWDKLVVVGGVRRFDDYVFSSPRSPETEVIGFPWQRQRWSPNKDFRGGMTGVISQRQRVSESSQSQADNLANIDLQAIQERLLVDAVEEDEEDAVLLTNAVLVDARLHELFGGKAVFLEVSDRRVTMIVDLDADRDDRVRQVPDSEVEEGMFVVLRTDSQGGYIVPIANQLIGSQAASFRELQSLWKSRLRTEVIQRGSKEVEGLLVRNGSSRANYQNLQNWMSPQSIAPELADDFQAIAVICGLEPQFAQMRRVARELRVAHMNAGQRVRKLLRELVMEADIEWIERQGYERFEIPELPGAQLTAFRIEARSQRVTSVAASTIERVFELDLF